MSSANVELELPAVTKHLGLLDVRFNLVAPEQGRIRYHWRTWETWELVFVADNTGNHRREV